jgi:hypothetical protein
MTIEHPRAGFLLAPLALLLAGSTYARDDAPVTYSLDLHFSSGSYSGCGSGSVAPAFGCADIATGNEAIAPPLLLSVLLGGVVPHAPGSFGGIGGVQFGIDYPPSVLLGQWTLCTGGAEVPEAAWPAARTGNAITWPQGCLPSVANPAGLVRVGFFTIDAGSTGVVDLIGDPRMDDAAWFYDCEAEGYFLCDALLGSANATIGGSPAAIACGGSCGVVNVPNGQTVATSWGRIKSLYE